MEPGYNEVSRDWQNSFATTRFRCIEVLSHIFYYYWGRQDRSLYRGLRYIEVRYINVPLYLVLVNLLFASLNFDNPQYKSNIFHFTVTCSQALDLD